MRRTLFFTFVGSAALGVALVSGQENADRRDRIGPRPLVAALDTNRDATISSQELAAASASLLALDVNGDGQLSVDELRPAGRGRRGEARPDSPDGQPQQGRGAGRRGPRADTLAGVLDANGDRMLSAEEIAAASGALKKLDRNTDGQLTRDELRSAFGRRGGPRRGNQVEV